MGSIGAYAVFRGFLAVATWASVGLGLLTRDPRWFLASGLLGAIWWTSDILMALIFDPLANFFGQLFGGQTNLPPSETLFTVEETIRLLEHHIQGNASRHVQIQSAVRLADLYRVADRNEVRSRAVLELVRSRFPDADELQSKK